MTIKKKLLKIICLIFFLGNACSVKAQMDMSKPMNMTAMHHQYPDQSKNIYLLMMDTMMIQMDKVPPVTSPESDFLYQMIPHHEGAIAMAGYEIAHGQNFEMIQLAKSILTEQTSEVQQMNLWLLKNRPKPTSLGNYNQEMGQTMKLMMDTMPADATLKSTDQAFASVMVPHHQAAIDMARVLIKYAKDPELIAYAHQLISNEQVEIEQMKQFLN